MKCLNCKKLLTGRSKKYCDNKCQRDWQYKQYIERWLLGQEDGLSGSTQTSKHLRRWVFEKQSGRCAICDIAEWLHNPVPLVMDHVDGNSKNNSPSNLRMVCGNCDMLLPTYKNKNRGNGRFARNQRYKEGKSY